jgi:DNA-binding response OmpR family regulator
MEVKVTNDGAKTIELVKSWRPDLLLLDIMMPNVSGIEILGQLREEYQKNQLPIIMITSKESPKDIVSALKMGANDYITKPADIDIVTARIETQLEIIKLSKLQAQAKQLEAISAMIVTYNHEIRNPLTIAIGVADRLKRTVDPELYDKLNNAHWRIKDIVDQISKVTDNNSVIFDQYGNKNKMIKLK